MTRKAPVEKVGGTQTNGPWPDEVDEIIEGKAYRRPVQVDNQVVEREVTVTTIRDVMDDSGNPSGGKIVAFQFDPDGGSQ